MKKTKKLSAILLASLISAGSISSLSTGAFYHAEEYGELNEYLNDFFVIPKTEGELYSESPRPNKESTFYISKTDHNLSVEVYDTKSTYVNMVLSGDTNIEEIQKVIYDICPNAYFSTNSIINDKLVIYVHGFSGELPFEEAKKENISLEQASKIKKKINDISVIEKFCYNSPGVSYDYHQRYMTHYVDISGNDKEIIETFISDNDLKCHFEPFSFVPGETNTNHFLVVPDDDITTTEHYDIANSIYKETGILPYIEYFETFQGTSETTIDLHNNIEGDANDDGKLALSDAVAIMQTVGNPDTYGLTAQGEYNADIAGDFDGITNLDALTVQRKLLKLE